MRIILKRQALKSPSLGRLGRRLVNLEDRTLFYLCCHGFSFFDCVLFVVVPTSAVSDLASPGAVGWGPPHASGDAAVVAHGFGLRGV
jgi:hypothetical protein